MQTEKRFEKRTIRTCVYLLGKGACMLSGGPQLTDKSVERDTVNECERRTMNVRDRKERSRHGNTHARKKLCADERILIHNTERVVRVAVA